MSIYSNPFMAEVETYIKLCEFRKKLETCPDSPKTKLFKAKLDLLILGQTAQRESAPWTRPETEASVNQQTVAESPEDMQSGKDDSSYNRHLFDKYRFGPRSEYADIIYEHLYLPSLDDPIVDMG